MEIKNTTNNRKSIIGGTVSIYDLRDMDFKDQELSPQQRLALKNFDRYRIKELNNQVTESAFNKKYRQLQVMANLSPFDEFLKEIYFI